MLLIFFLVTSSMDAGQGLRRQLPPPPQQEEEVADIRQEDIISVELDASNRLTLNGEAVGMDELQRRVREFAAVNPHRRVVAVKTDRQTTYDAYFQLQDAIVAAYKPLKCAPRISESDTAEEGGMEP